jgi:hypothetical protein
MVQNISLISRLVILQSFADIYACLITLVAKNGRKVRVLPPKIKQFSLHNHEGLPPIAPGLDVLIEVARHFHLPHITCNRQLFGFLSASTTCSTAAPCRPFVSCLSVCNQAAGRTGSRPSAHRHHVTGRVLLRGWRRKRGGESARRRQRRRRRRR